VGCHVDMVAAEDTRVYRRVQAAVVGVGVPVQDDRRSLKSGSGGGDGQVSHTDEDGKQDRHCNKGTAVFHGYVLSFLCVDAEARDERGPGR